MPSPDDDAAYVDTSAFLALLDRADPAHRRARRCFERLGDADARLATSNYVLVETFALVQRRHGMDAVRRFHSDVLPLVDLLFVDPVLHGRAVAALLVAPRGLSLVDLASFEVMRAHGLSTAFAFDPDFTSAGFSVIPPTSR